MEVRGGENETFSLTVGGETKAGLSMKKGEGYVGDAAFSAVKITGVGSVLPEDGRYTLSGAGSQPLGVADIVGDPSDRTGLGGLEAIEEIRLVAVPDLMVGYDGSAQAKERVKMVQEAVIAHCERLKYRFAILDTPPGLNAQAAKEWREYINFDFLLRGPVLPLAARGRFERQRRYHQARPAQRLHGRRLQPLRC